MKKLRGVEEALANFFASGPLALGPKLGPVLWQLPPNLGYHPERIEDFLRLLPRTTAEAAALAEGHTDKVPEPCTETDEDRPLRHAMEVRHASYRDPGFVDQLRRYGVALVVADTAGHLPAPRRRHRRPRLRPPPRRHRALRQRLHPRRARPVGGHDPRLGRGRGPDHRGHRGARRPAAARAGGARRRRLLRQRRQGARAVRRDGAAGAVSVTGVTCGGPRPRRRSRGRRRRSPGRRRAGAAARRAGAARALSAASSPPAQAGSARTAATPKSTPITAKATARRTCPAIPSQYTGRRRLRGQPRPVEVLGEVEPRIPVHAVAPAITSTTRPDDARRGPGPPGSASSPAVACCEPPLLDPDEPVTSSCTPMRATASTPSAVAPAPIRRCVRAQPDAQRNPVSGREALPDPERDEAGDDDHEDDHEPEGLGRRARTGRPAGRPARRRAARSAPRSRR